MPEEKKPIVKLLEYDKSALYILAKLKKTMERARWSNEKIKIVLAELQKGDYKNLIKVAYTYFDVQ